MDNSLSLYEVLSRVSKAKGREEKIRLLQKYNSRYPGLARFLKFTYRKDIVFDLPEGIPPFKESEATDQFDNLAAWRELKKLDYLLKGSGVAQVKRENIYINMLETVSPTDAKLFVQMTQGKIIDPPFITKRLVGDAFPGMFPGKSADQDD